MIYYKVKILKLTYKTWFKYWKKLKFYFYCKKNFRNALFYVNSTETYNISTKCWIFLVHCRFIYNTSVYEKGTFVSRFFDSHINWKKILNSTNIVVWWRRCVALPSSVPRHQSSLLTMGHSFTIYNFEFKIYKPI